MGNCFNQSDSEKQNNIVNQQLARDRKRFTTVKKILFLGSGGSGKSTIFKQLRGIYGTGFNHNERKQFVGHIHEQVITQMRLALEVLEEYRNGDFDGIMRQNERAYVDQKQRDSEDDDDYDDDDDDYDYDIPELSEGAVEAQAYLNHIHFTSYKLNDDIVTHLKCLWAEPAIQKMYELRNITKIEDSSAYFWNKLDSLNNFGYVPDEADILLVRNRTTGAKEEKYDMPDGKGSFSIVDVGGQKSERKKWIKCFDSVTAVIFVASLSCYDEVLFEDYAINSMTDQLELFDSVCNNVALRETSMILFLNKKDLFIEKIKNVSITKCASFRDYRGDPNGFDATTQYIRKAFTSLNNMPNRKNIFTHTTCATDQDNIQKVFADVQHIVIEASLIQAGLMDWDDNQRFQSVDIHNQQPGMGGGGESSPMGDPQTAAIIRESIMHSNKMKSINAAAMYGGYANSASMGSGGLRAMIKTKSIHQPHLNSVQYATILQQYKYDEMIENARDFSDEYGLLKCRYCWAQSTAPPPLRREEETFVVLDIEPDIERQSTKQRKQLNLCIVLDVCDAMDAEFTDGQKKMEVVKQCIVDIARNRLKKADRLCLITYNDATQVRVIQEIESIEKINIDRLCNTIATEIAPCSQSQPPQDSSGYQRALSQFKKLRTQRKVSMAYSNRIMMISTARLSEAILTDAVDAARNGEATKRVYSSFIGICNRFNLQRSELNDITGCNHACIYSSEQLKHALVTRFDEMMTPLMFNLTVRLKHAGVGDEEEHMCVAHVRRLNGTIVATPQDKDKGAAAATVLDLATIFQRKKARYGDNEEYDEDRKLLLIKLVPGAANRNNLELVLSFTDENSQKVTNVVSMALLRSSEKEESNNSEEEHKNAALLNGKSYGGSGGNTGNNDYFDNTAIRKAVLLSRYINILKLWLQETNDSKYGVASTAFQKKIEYFIQYFKTESRAIDDRSLSQEVNVLQSMLNK